MGERAKKEDVLVGIVAAWVQDYGLCVSAQMDERGRTSCEAELVASVYDEYPVDFVMGKTETS